MRTILSSTFAAIVFAVAACGGDSGTGPAAASIAGTYTLKTVNSTPLPYTMPDDGTGTIEILGDSYTLADDGNYTQVTQFRLTVPGQSPGVFSLNSHGTYAVAGSTITLADADDPTDKATATLNAKTLTFSVEGFVLVYQQSGG
jgi:hypothetical protein